MKKHFSIYILIFAGCLMISCGSGDNKESPAKGGINKFADETADKIFDHMKSPLDAARSAQEKANRETERREQNMDETN